MRSNQYTYLVIILMLLYEQAWSARYAFLIGHNNGGKEVEDLKYAETDAQRFSLLLNELAGFNKENVELLLSPDSAQVEEKLVGLRSRLKNRGADENDLVLIYYSGHADEDGLKLGHQSYPLIRVKEHINSLRASIKIGIFDACQSGAVTRFKGGKRGEPFFLESQKKVHGQIIIASSAANELAQESNSLKGSIFSHHWINGLRGSADFSGDKKVTINEAYRYAYHKTIETTALSGGGIQHPSYKFNIYGEGDILITDLAGETGGIVFEPSLTGKCLVLSEDYMEIFADFYKKSGREVFISLNPGHYTIVNTTQGKTGVHNLSINNQVAYVGEESMVENPVFVNRVKGTNSAAKKAIETKSGPLSRYTLGIGAGAVFGLNDELRNKDIRFNVLFSNLWYIEENFNLFSNLEWTGFGHNYGANLGFDYFPGAVPGMFYTGLGAGFYVYDKPGKEFADDFGPAVTLHIGGLINLGDRVQLKVELPYTAVFNDSFDKTIGLNFSLLFSGPYRHVNVLKK